jgi:AraC-like DNA-binding protein
MALSSSPMVGVPPRARITRGHLGAARWEIATRSPAPGLRAHVRELLGYVEETPGPLRRRELPGPQIVLIIELGAPLRVFDHGSDRVSRYPGGFVAGLHDSFTLTEHDGVQRGLQVNLTPIGARLFFGIPMSELTGRVVALRDLLPKEHRTLAERLEALPSWDARFDLVERVLLDRLAAVSFPVSVVAWAFDRIEERGGAVDIGALAREMGYSQKHVIGLFREHVGVPPKLAARIVRFDRLIQHLKTGASGTWADLALELGFYDQAHLVRDVKQFSGTTPTRARAELIDLTSLPE